MIKPNTNYLTTIEDCKVHNPLINEINDKILAIANKMKITAYIHKYNRGILRYISIRVNRLNEVLVTLICGEKNNKIKELAEEIFKIDEVKGVYENFNMDKKSINPFGDETNHLFGEKYIIEKLGNIEYKIYPTTFFQLNTKQAEVLVENVKKIAKLSGKEEVLDAYCGVGAIGLYLAKNSKNITGIENNKEAIIAANDNAKLNNINNAKFFEGDASLIITKMINDGNQFDVVVVDPPRTGLDNKLLNTLHDSNIKKIIYVSCNPATLAKNIDKLSDKYQVKQIIPLDLFPFTSHCESITLLTLKN
jgi:23S rRNA (uracil-5-)-methyltransferase RumA